MFRLAALLAVLITLWPTPAQAQSAQLYGNRLASKDGAWLLPVATLHLGSDEEDHIGRGSIASWDLVAPLGTPVFAVGPGVVRVTGCNLFEKKQWHNMQGYGCAVQIDHGDSISTQYGHCQQGSFFVKAGDTVDQWTPICRVGWTGKTSFGPHTHFVILRGGAAARVDAVFDIAKMYHKPLSNAASGEVIESGIGVVDGNGTVTASQRMSGESQTQQQMPPGWKLLSALTPESFGLLVSTGCVLLLFLFWVGGTLVRTALVAVVAGSVAAFVIVQLFAPVAMVAGQQAASAGGDSFETALKVTLKREGAGCDTYIVRTLHGVTQWTYDRYRREKGLPKADVCTALTEAEERYIYYNYYWLPSGASQLPVNAAIPVFDHYVNAGRKISGCGSDVRCINQQRLQFYLGTKDCARRTRVCQAWLDRVDYIRKLTGG